MRSLWRVGLGLLIVGGLSACGQGPSFLENQNVDPLNSGNTGKGGDQTGTGSGDVTAKQSAESTNVEDDVPIMIDDNGRIIPNPGSGASGAGQGSGTGKTGDEAPPKPVVIGPDPGYKLPPGVGDSDAAALHQCLMKLNGQLPPKFKYYHKIAAQVSVFGVGPAINDTFRTDGPALTLIVAGVNVGGTPVYNFMNPNGYYCIKVGVNVLTNLTVNLHCNARLADSKVNVNVGSTVNDTTAAIGVAVMSTITVNPQRPAGDACIR